MSNTEKHTSEVWKSSANTGHIYVENGDIGDIVCLPPSDYVMSMEHWPRRKELIIRAPEMLAELTTLNNQVGELLAVMHGDGGHYQQKHGTAKAIKDAMDRHWNRIKEHDEESYALRKENEKLNTENKLKQSIIDGQRVKLSELTQERDDLHGLVLRLTGESNELGSIELSFIRVQGELREYVKENEKLREALTELARFPIERLADHLQYPDNLVKAIDEARKLLKP